MFQSTVQSDNQIKATSGVELATPLPGNPSIEEFQFPKFSKGYYREQFILPSFLPESLTKTITKFVSNSCVKCEQPYAGGQHDEDLCESLSQEIRSLEKDLNKIVHGKIYRNLNRDSCQREEYRKEFLFTEWCSDKALEWVIADFNTFSVEQQAQMRLWRYKSVVGKHIANDKLQSGDLEKNQQMIDRKIVAMQAIKKKNPFAKPAVRNDYPVDEKWNPCDHFQCCEVKSEPMASKKTNFCSETGYIRAEADQDGVEEAKRNFWKNIRLSNERAHRITQKKLDKIRKAARESKFASLLSDVSYTLENFKSVKYSRRGKIKMQGGETHMYNCVCHECIPEKDDSITSKLSEAWTSIFGADSTYGDAFESFIDVGVFIWQLTRANAKEDIIPILWMFVTKSLRIYSNGDYSIGKLFDHLVEVFFQPFGKVTMQWRVSTYLEEFSTSLHTFIKGDLATAIQNFLGSIVAFRVFPKETAMRIYKYIPKPTQCTMIDLVVFFTKSATSIIVAFENWWNGTSSLREIMFKGSTLHENLNIAKELLLYKDMLYCGVAQPGKRHREEWIKDMNAMITYFENVIKKMRKDAPLYSEVSKILAALHTTILPVIDAAKAENRVPPLLINLCGTPGVGKACLLDFIPSRYCAVSGVNFSKDMVYAKTAESDFWEKYNWAEHWFVHFSEPSSECKELVMKKGQPLIAQILSLCDSRKRYLNTAFGDKGSVLFNSKLLLLDNNNPGLWLRETMVAPAASFRRMIRITPIVLPEYRMKGSMQLDANLAKNAPSPYHLWTFIVETFVAKSNKDFDTIIHLNGSPDCGIDALADFLDEKFASHIQVSMDVNKATSKALNENKYGTKDVAMPVVEQLFKKEAEAKWAEDVKIEEDETFGESLSWFFNDDEAVPNQLQQFNQRVLAEVRREVRKIPRLNLRSWMEAEAILKEHILTSMTQKSLLNYGAKIFAANPALKTVIDPFSNEQKTIMQAGDSQKFSKSELEKAIADSDGTCGPIESMFVTDCKDRHKVVKVPVSVDDDSLMINQLYKHHLNMKGSYEEAKEVDELLCDDSEDEVSVVKTPQSSLSYYQWAKQSVNAKAPGSLSF
jgi:hypothetical protein